MDPLGTDRESIGSRYGHTEVYWVEWTLELGDTSLGGVYDSTQELYRRIQKRSGTFT